MNRQQELQDRFAKEPLVGLLGAKLEALFSWGNAVVTALARPDLCILGGVVQGGIVATLADYAAVYAAMVSIPSGHTPAMQINITCLRPIREGERMRAEAKVVNETRGHLMVDVHVYGDGDKCRANGQILFAKPR